MSTIFAATVSGVARHLETCRALLSSTRVAADLRGDLVEAERIQGILCDLDETSECIARMLCRS